MATIRRRTGQGGVSFHVQVRIKGHAPETATFRRLTDARRWAQQTEAAIREGRHFPRSAARAHTLAEAIDRYMKTILPHKAKHTVDVQNPQLAWWQAQIGHLSLADVIPAIVAEQRDILLQRFTPGTVNRYLAALSDEKPVGNIFC
jgi:signal recognition particle subunit SEC65